MFHPANIAQAGKSLGFFNIGQEPSELFAGWGRNTGLSFLGKTLTRLPLSLCAGGVEGHAHITKVRSALRDAGEHREIGTMAVSAAGIKPGPAQFISTPICSSISANVPRADCEDSWGLNFATLGGDLSGVERRPGDGNLPRLRNSRAAWGNPISGVQTLGANRKIYE